jgi:hypothetical protein
MGPLSGSGDPQRWHVHRERIYIFASDQCREGFKKRADAFLPVEEKASTAAAAVTAGEALLGRAAKAHGGAERIKAWRSYRHDRAATKGKASEQWRWWLQLPATVRLDHDYTQDGKTWRYAQIVSPAANLFVTEGMISAMQPPASREVHRNLSREPLLALRLALDGNAVATAASASQREVAGIAVDELAICSDGSTTVFGIDRDGRVRTARFRGRGPGLWFGDVVLVFDDYQTAGGLQVPGTIRATFEGKDAPELAERRERIEIDGVFDPALFAPK